MIHVHVTKGELPVQLVPSFILDSGHAMEVAFVQFAQVKLVKACTKYGCTIIIIRQTSSTTDVIGTNKHYIIIRLVHTVEMIAVKNESYFGPPEK